jgi:hypothetical protein
LTTHRYTVGETVYFMPARADRSAATAGSYKITRLMPEEQGDRQYRIKSTSDAHERTAGESQLGRTRANSAFKR